MDILRNKKANKIRNKTMFKGCVHQDSTCNGTTSDAHSIQNKRILNKLADENGKVICIDFGKAALYRNIKLDEVGRGKASTFTGFCNEHDSKIFKPIEEVEYIINNNKQEFLFAYRAFALSYYERHSSYGFMKEHLELKRKESSADLDDFEKRVLYYKKHLEYIENLRITMNKNLDAEKYFKISTVVLDWPENYQIAATSMFFINKDTKGNIINDPSSYLSPFFFTIIPQGDRTIVLMSYFTKDKHRYEFLYKQISKAKIDMQKIFISNILAMNVENFFIAPSRWGTFPEKTKKLFLKILQSTGGKEKPRIGYFNELNLFI
ncbi:hypothetical protein NDS46_29395 [Paenibacillus thiaminolyticus]|uniref:hypothetical protein n=1 Tax=Paenibacillus thiaminolyticus TaxID=49283 RepID=UPI00232DE048|nr:hypothetical protein [Paenibacillus thiaminolyticus]WCF08317.1 hypothetical protein NDS46_29395 [Paenibacillus thiaminolyticus]